MGTPLRGEQRSMADSQENLCSEIIAAVGLPLCEDLASRAVASIDRAVVEKEALEKRCHRSEAKEKKAAARNKVLSAEVRSLRARIERLERDLDKKNRMAFGSQADRQKREAPTDQEERAAQEAISAGTDDEPAASPPPTDREDSGRARRSKKAKPKHRNGRGMKNYGDLRRVEEIIGSEHCRCGCGGGIVGYDKKEVLTVIPVEFYIRVIKSPKHRCLRLNRIIGTPFPPQIFPGGEASNSLMAHTMVSKFDWAMPYYRQERVAWQGGVNIQRSTLARNVNKLAGQALVPIYDLLEKNILDESTVLHMDASVVHRQINGRGKVTHRDLVAIARDGHGYGEELPPAVVYYVYPSLTQKVVADLLAGHRLAVQHDGASVFNKLGEPDTGLADITSAECWAHCRRYFIEEYNYNKTKHADDLIQLINRMYRIEEPIRGSSPRVRRRVRQRLTKPIMDEIYRRLHEYQSHHLEKGGMGKAISYALRRWRGLSRFLDNGRLELDNNNVERLFRPPILARKNSLFIGSDLGEKAWAVLFSLIETCLLNSVDPYRYLLWVLDQIAHKKPRAEYAELLPWNAPDSCRVNRKGRKAKRRVLP